MFQRQEILNHELGVLAAKCVPVCVCDENFLTEERVSAPGYSNKKSLNQRRRNAGNFTLGTSTHRLCYITTLFSRHLLPFARSE